MVNTNYFRIFNAIGIFFTIISLLSTIFVISTILIRRCLFRAKNDSNYAITQQENPADPSTQSSNKMSLHQYTIFGLLISDLMFEIAYMPSQISWLWFISYDKLDGSKLREAIVVIGGEAAESFFIASGLWSLAIALSVWIGIRRVTQRQKLRISHSKQQRHRSSSLIESSRSDVIPSPYYSKKNADATFSHHSTNHSSSKSATTPSTFRVPPFGALSPLAPGKKFGATPSSALGTPLSATPSTARTPLSPLMPSRHSSQFMNSSTRSALSQTSSADAKKMDSAPSAHRHSFVGGILLEALRLPKRTRFWITVISFGLPLLSWLIWSSLNMYLQVYAPSPMTRHLSFIISDCYHTVIYSAIELATIVLRVLIYFKVKSLFAKTQATMWKHTPQVDKMNHEKRKFFIQSIMYSLPFLVCGTFLIVARTWIDVEVIMKICSEGINGDWSNENFSTVAFVLISAHRCIFPLRGFMDSLVYCWLSNWFRNSFRTCVFWSRKAESEEKKTLLR